MESSEPCLKASSMAFRKLQALGPGFQVRLNAGVRDGLRLVACFKIELLCCVSFGTPKPPRFQWAANLKPEVKSPKAM